MENDNNIKIIIHEEKNCSWCHLPNEQFIYGNNKDEIESVLNKIEELKIPLY